MNNPYKISKISIFVLIFGKRLLRKRGRGAGGLGCKGTQRRRHSPSRMQSDAEQSVMLKAHTGRHNMPAMCAFDSMRMGVTSLCGPQKKKKIGREPYIL